MKIGILSDTHDQFARTEVAIAMLAEQGAELFVHCGDWISPDMVYLFDGHSLILTTGNNDSPRDIERAARAIGATFFEKAGSFTLAGKLCAVTHGDHRPTLAVLLSQSPAYCFVGHSHQQSIKQIGATRLVNPGALHRVVSFSVALLDLETESLRFVDVPRAGYHPGRVAASL